MIDGPAGPSPDYSAEHRPHDWTKEDCRSFMDYMKLVFGPASKAPPPHERQLELFGRNEQ